ncbi:MAG: hypothetical protein U5K33_02190 [Halofilum sp. (in: g-proteobacteria)]|nr:hypothetical protein [Halofilum sp. (in: g-proteobacteria)]
MADRETADLERRRSEQVRARPPGSTGRRPAWPELGAAMPALPGLAHEVLTQAKEGRLSIEWRNDELPRLRAELRHQQRQNRRVAAGVALLFGAILLHGLGAPAGLVLAGIGVVVWVLGGLGLGLLGVGLFGK